MVEAHLLHELLEVVRVVRRAIICGHRLNISKQGESVRHHGLHLLPVGAGAHFHHWVPGVLVYEGVQVILVSYGALEVGVQVLPGSVR